MNEPRAKQEKISNEQLVSRIKAGENVAENMLKLWQQTEPYIYQVAKKYSRYAEIADLVQEGYFGLNQAVEHYRPDHGTKFISYLTFWLEQVMKRYIENSGVVRIPSWMYQNLIKYNRFTREYEQEWGCEPSELQIRAFMQLDGEEVGKLQKIRNMQYTGSLEAPVPGVEDCTLSDTVASNENLEDETIDRLDKEEAYKSLWKSLDNLPDNEKDVIRMKYKDCEKWKNIAASLGVSLNTARTYQHKALGRLRRQEKAPWYKYYEQNCLEAVKLRHVGINAFNRTWTSETEREAIRFYELL